jgi:RNA polymerase sigma factor (sigma-70 family)
MRCLYWAACHDRFKRRAPESAGYYPKDSAPPKTRPLTVVEERALFRRVARGVPGAFEQAVTQHLRWALKLATTNHGKTALKGARFTTEDAISAANAGLVEAVRTYRLSKGARFTTHAITVVRRYLINALLDTYPVKVSYHYRKKLSEQDPKSTATVFERLFSGEPCEKAAAALHERPEDAPYLPAEAEDPANTRSILRADVQEFLTTLTPLERAAIQARYFAETPESYRSIGARLHVSKNTIREAHDLALTKLRRRFKE